MLLRESNAAYTLVLLWAFAGIELKHADIALLANTVWVASGLLLIRAVLMLVRKNNKRLAVIWQ